MKVFEVKGSCAELTYSNQHYLYDAILKYSRIGHTYTEDDTKYVVVGHKLDTDNVTLLLEKVSE